MRNQLIDTGSLLLGKVKLHMSCVLLKTIQHSFVGSAQNVVDSMDLIQFVGSWKEWKKTTYIEKYAPNTPDVHLLVVVTIG